MAKSKKSIVTKKQVSATEDAGAQPLLESFIEVVEMIRQARQQAFQVVNTTLIDLYWRVGEYISHKMETSAWGESVVDQLAEYIIRQHPDIKGFTRRNLYRMRQFFENISSRRKSHTIGATIVLDT